MNFNFMFNRKKESIESLENGIRIKEQEFKALVKHKPFKEGQGVTSEKALEYFQARPEMIDEKLRAADYRLYLARELRLSMKCDYDKIAECRESDEIKARRQIEKKNQ